MSYEPGVLVRRQQREYPPELRQEIALAALEVGNNREVARLYSEQLGYTVNESTVRGIKKRYLEGVHKGKIDSPALSPRASSLTGDNSRSSDNEDSTGFQPEQVMKLKLEVLEGKMKDPSGFEMMEGTLKEEDELNNVTEINSADALVINDNVVNGDDSRDSSCNQLSIDIGSSEENVDSNASPTHKSTIRFATGLQKSPGRAVEKPNTLITGGILAATLSGVKRKSSNGPSFISSVVPPVKKPRPNAAEVDAEIATLDKEIKALQWLARKKEQEWDQAVRLLKQKEEKLMRAQRTRFMIQTETEHLLSKYKSPSPVVVPQQQVLILPSTTGNRLIQPKPAASVPAVISSIVGGSGTPSPAVSPTRRIIKSTASAVQQQSSTASNKVASSTAPLQKQTVGVATSSISTEASNSSTTVISVRTGTVIASAVKQQQESTESKHSSVLEMASKNLTAKQTEETEDIRQKNTPTCQGCGQKKSEFVCAGCSARWYCSRDCQVEDWDEHADDCAG